MNISNNDSHTPIIAAAFKGDEDICSILINQGADINAADRHGRTALCISEEVGNEGIAKLLIAHGINTGPMSTLHQNLAQHDFIVLHAMGMRV